MKNIFKHIGVALTVGVLLASCQKMERPALGEYPTDNPVTPTTELRFYVPFDSTKEDAKQINIRFEDNVSGYPSYFPSKEITFVEGIKGTAYKGADATALKYVNANDFKLATSFTVAFWMKQNVNTRTEFLFGLQDDTYGWSHSSLFMMVEHTTLTDATVKVGVMDQWMEFAGANKLQKPMFDGNWHHWAMTYDETTSKMAYFFDGVLVASPPASATDVKKDGAPRGKLDLSKSAVLSIGGWGKHVGIPGPTDSWVGSYTGQLDQFRLYNKVLGAGEINALFANKE